VLVHRRLVSRGGIGDNGTVRSHRTAAQWFCLLGGAVLLVRGLVGFAFLDTRFGLPGEGWHHLIHLASGAILVAGGMAPVSARVLAIGFGLVYAGFAGIGIADGDDVLGLIAADTADKIFHAVIGLASLGAGLASPAGPPPEPAVT
jgi:hypothetical protein